MEIGTNLAAVIVASLGLVGTIITAFLTYKNGKGIAEVKDGMQTRMLDAQRGEAAATGRAAGVVEGEAKEQARASAPTT